MRENPKDIGDHLPPIIFLLISFSMQLENSSKLSELTFNVWNEIKNEALKTKILNLLQ